MTENDSSSSASASAPKKLKLTLKLNSSSSFSSSTTTPASSQLNSSLPASPIKEEISTSVPVGLLSDLPAGLGNLKGRGRPKKPATPKPTEPSSNESNASTTSNSTQPSNPTPVPVPNEYASDLKSFVTSMKTFKCRNWSLNRPITLDTKNVAGYSVSFDSGLWCTVSTELGSAHLRSIDTQIASTVSNTTSSLNESFEVTCQCGKIFNNQSKYKKHSKIHEKVNGNVVTQTPAPSISLKIKLNTNGSNK